MTLAYIRTPSMRSRGDLIKWAVDSAYVFVQGTLNGWTANEVVPLGTPVHKNGTVYEPATSAADIDALIVDEAKWPEGATGLESALIEGGPAIVSLNVVQDALTAGAVTIPVADLVARLKVLGIKTMAEVPGLPEHEFPVP